MTASLGVIFISPDGLILSKACFVKGRMEYATGTFIFRTDYLRWETLAQSPDVYMHGVNLTLNMFSMLYLYTCHSNVHFVSRLQKTLPQLHFLRSATSLVSLWQGLETYHQNKAYFSSICRMIHRQINTCMGKKMLDCGMQFIMGK